MTKPPAPPSDELSPQQQMFAYEYVKDWNGTRAAERAGYSGNDNVLAVQASRLLRNAKVQDYISAFVDSVGMSAAEVITLISEHGRASLRPFYTESGGEYWPDLTTDAAEQHFHLLKKIKTKRRSGGPPDDPWTETEVELEIHDRLAAQTLMARRHKLLTDRVEQSGPNGGPIRVEDVGAYRGMDRADLNRGIEQALKPPTAGP